MTTQAGAQTDTRETDAFGANWNPGTTLATPTPFGFAGAHGYKTDPDSGLMMLGHRYYDNSVGRFLSRDPIRDGYNWYAYVENDPVNAVDPEGLDSNDGSVENNSKELKWAVGTTPSDRIEEWEKGDPRQPGLPDPDVIIKVPGRKKPLMGWRVPKSEYIMVPVKPGERVGGDGLDIDAGWHDGEWVGTGGKKWLLPGVGSWGPLEGNWSEAKIIFHPAPKDPRDGPVPMPKIKPRDIIRHR